MYVLKLTIDTYRLRGLRREFKGGAAHCRLGTPGPFPPHAHDRAWLPGVPASLRGRPAGGALRAARSGCLGVARPCGARPPMAYGVKAISLKLSG